MRLQDGIILLYGRYDWAPQDPWMRVESICHTRVAIHPWEERDAVTIFNDQSRMKSKKKHTALESSELIRGCLSWVLNFSTKSDTRSNWEIPLDTREDCQSGFRRVFIFIVIAGQSLFVFAFTRSSNLSPIWSGDPEAGYWTMRSRKGGVKASLVKTFLTTSKGSTSDSRMARMNTTLT